MGEALKRRLKQAHFEDSIQEALLNLLVAANDVREQIDRACSDYGVTLAQYNVLRILKGAHPHGQPRGEIAVRMIERAPDVTRMVERLENQGLVERDRSEQDRRLSITRITPKGLKLLDQLRPRIDEVHRYFAERVSLRDRRELTRICEGIYGEWEHRA